MLPGQKKPPAPPALSGGDAFRGPDLRQRHRLHGRSGSDCHRGQRRGPAGHQYGLPGGQGGLQRRRRGADAGPGKGRPAGGGRGEGVPGACDGEDAPGLGQGQYQRGGAEPDAGAGGGIRRDHPWPDTGADVRRSRRLVHHPGGEGGGVHPGHRQRGRVLPPGRGADFEADRRGHGHDRSGLLRQPLAVPAGRGGAGWGARPGPAPPGGAVRYGGAADRAGGGLRLRAGGGAHRPAALRLVSQGRAPCVLLQGTDRPHGDAGGCLSGDGRNQEGSA